MSKLVLWSGGCDSTLCLYDAARRASAENPVSALSVVHTEVSAAREQHMARQRILTRFKKDGLHVIHTTVRVRVSGDFYISPRGCPQPMVWLPCAMLYLQKKQDLIFGYVRGDDFWHYREAFQRIFDATNVFNHHATGRLEFPLEWTPKDEVLKRLKKAGLLKLCWWCENPTKGGRPCRKCPCCQTHRDAKVKAGL